MRIFSTIIILLILAFSGCAESGDKSGGCASVTIDLGLEANKAAPSNITSIKLTISAADMTTIITEIPVSTGAVTIEVPSGSARQFTVSAITPGIDFKGTAVQNLDSGETVTVPITMKVDKVIPTLTVIGSGEAFNSAAAALGIFLSSYSVNLTQNGSTTTNT